MKHFDRESFFRGFARALDLRGSVAPRYTRRARWHRNDHAAIAADWRAVWGDFDAAFARVRQRDGECA